MLATLVSTLALMRPLAVSRSALSTEFPTVPCWVPPATRCPIPTMQTQEEVETAVEQAIQFADHTISILGEDVPPPKSLAFLKEAISRVEQAGLSPLREAIYVTLIEQTLDYEVVDDGKLVLSSLDYNDTEDERVLSKMQYLYRYGINMLQMGYIAGDAVKSIVLEKLAARVSMSGEEFDKWLDMPAVA